MVTLQVYIEQDCWNCAESRRIATEIGPLFPQVAVEVVDLSAVSPPDNIFAVPTYVLDGRIIYLGNPFLDDLCERLQDALDGQ